MWVCEVCIKLVLRCGVFCVCVCVWVCMLQCVITDHLYCSWRCPCSHVVLVLEEQEEDERSNVR